MSFYSTVWSNIEIQKFTNNIIYQLLKPELQYWQLIQYSSGSAALLSFSVIERLYFYPAPVLAPAPAQYPILDDHKFHSKVYFHTPFFLKLNFHEEK